MRTGSSSDLIFPLLKITTAVLLFVPALTRAQVTVGERESALSLTSRLGLQGPTSLADTGTIVAAGDTTGIRGTTKSPFLAVTFSIFPGGGQIYNGSYWKVPIVWGVQAFFISQWVANNRYYKSYKADYANSITPSNPYGDVNYKNYRDSYLDQRDSYAWYIAGAYLLSMLDAYVDAELSGFDVSPGLAFNSPHPAPAISFRLRF